MSYVITEHGIQCKKLAENQRVNRECPDCPGECVHHTSLIRSPFKIGDRVNKVSGDYHIKGEVRSVFTKADGATRLVVEHQAEGGGSFLHIYSPANLVRLKDSPVTCAGPLISETDNPALQARVLDFIRRSPGDPEPRECRFPHKLQGTGAAFFQSAGLLQCNECKGWQLIRKPIK